MTNKEAISIITQIKGMIMHNDSWCDEAKVATKEAFDLAIKALEEVEEWHKLKLICANEGIIVYKARGKEE